MLAGYYPPAVVALALITTLHSVYGCSHVRVSTPEGDVIGRTMELDGLGSHPQNPLNWSVSVHPIGELMGGKLMGAPSTNWHNVYSFVSIDLEPPVRGVPQLIAPIPTEGMNSAGLTVSTHTLRQSGYQPSINNAFPLHQNIYYNDFTGWALGSFGSVSELVTAVQRADVAVISEQGYNPANGIHWGIDDASGAHAVIEYLEGSLHVHNNTVGVMTNDPDFSWHLRNLNNYVSLNTQWPTQPFSYQTDVGAVPSSVGHGFNLRSLPGDTSPPARFVKLFYLKEFATRNHPPQGSDDGIVLATGLLNTVWINKGVVAQDAVAKESSFEFTQYSVLKLPQKRQLLFKTYRNNQWKRIQLGQMDLSKRAKMPLDDGTLGVKDVTLDFGLTKT